MIAATILLDGIDSNLLALAIPSLAREWNTDPREFASIAALSTVAMLIGSALAGVISDRLGRRWTLIAATAIYGGGTLTGAAADAMNILAATRIVTGLGLGAALTTAVVAVAEHFPPRMRATAVSLAVLGMPFGGVLSGILAAAVLDPLGWRVLLVIGGAAPLLLGFIYFFYLPESSAFVARQGGASRDPSTRQDKSRGNPLLLLSRELRRDTLLVWAGFFASLLASYMTLGWLPTLLTEAGAVSVTASGSIAYASTGSLIGGLLAVPLVWRFGTRGVMIAAAGLSCLVAGFLAARFDVLGPTPLALMAVGAMMAGFATLNSLFYGLLPQIYPAAVRGAGIGIGMAAGRLGAVASAYVGAWGLSGGGGRFFAIATAAALVALVSFGLVRRHSPSGRRQGEHG